MALKKVATRVRKTDEELAHQICNKFKEEFIIRYLKNENKWPPLDVSKLSPTNTLRQAYEHKANFPKHHKDYERTSLTFVSFLPTFPIDPKFDLVEMIADKAMSLFTPELIANLQSHRGVGSSVDRSVLVQWLKSALHDPKEFLTHVDLHGFSWLEKSVGLKKKEREGKLEARMLGLMTLIKRMYIVLTEALLSEHILKYFPEITMTDDEMSLDKKRLNFNDPKYIKYSLFTSLDFSKWNSNMREGDTKEMFSVFDELFGFNSCSSRTHELFNDSCMYL